MNYIQYMKPGSKFWALPNGLEDVSWSEFWSNWKKAIAKAKEQIVDNWENLKQDYKDAADPTAASERKQAESIEATRAKQASMKFVSDNRTDYEKKRDRKNFKLKEFEQKEQLNKDATDAMMWTLTGIPYAVQHLASPNGVVKTYGNTKAAVQNGGGPYLEKAVASAAGDVLDATILAAPLFTPEARLARAMNKNIRNTTLQPTVADEAILRGQLGWAPKQTIPYRHGSLDPELKTFVPKHDRWDVVTHGADPNMYFVTDQTTPVSAANMMDLRPYQYTGSIVAEKPMVQVGDFNIAGKNATRNQLIARARQQGADTYLLQDIVDNKVPHLNIVARFIGPEGEAVQGGAASIKWYGPTMGKTTAVKTNPNLVDIDPLLKPIRAKHAERLGLKISDPKVSADPAYKQEVADFVLEWRANPENLGKTLVASTKHLLDPQYKVEFANEPSIPDFETFAARNKARGFKETDEQLRAWYNSILELGRELNIDNRFVSNIESGTRSANISGAELAGIPKGDRKQAEIIELLKRQNTESLKLYLSSNLRRIPNGMPNLGPQIEQMKRFLASKVDIAQFSDEDILNLIKLRLIELNKSASGRFAMHADPTTYHLYTKGNNATIGRVNFGDNGDGTFGVGMVTNYTFGPNVEKGVSEDLYNLIINLAKLNGMKGLSSGRDLRSPLATTKIWEKYPNRIILSETGGTHNINGVNTPGPIVLLTEPSKPLVPLKSYLFDPSIIKDGQMIIDWNKGLYRKFGGTIHIKKENKGKFTDYCNGKVTEECIRKGKNSSNPTTRKRANFAWVARHKFKHEEGGKINYLNIF